VSEGNDGNVNIQSCEQAPDCLQFGWFQHLLPEGEDLCITLLILDKLSAKCNLDPSSVDKLDSETWLERVNSMVSLKFDETMDDNWLYKGSENKEKEKEEEEAFEDAKEKKKKKNGEKSNFIYRLMKSKIIQPGRINPIRSGVEDSYGIPFYNKGLHTTSNTAVNKESYNGCRQYSMRHESNHGKCFNCCFTKQYWELPQLSVR